MLITASMMKTARPEKSPQMSGRARHLPLTTMVIKPSETNARRARHLQPLSPLLSSFHRCLSKAHALRTDFNRFSKNVSCASVEGSRHDQDNRSDQEHCPHSLPAGSPVFHFAARRGF